jgi:hypothetical protein
MAKANNRRLQIADLKREIRAGHLDLAAILCDPRAQEISVLALMPTLPRCGQRTALQALLNCGINGADTCGELDPPRRRRLCRALSDLRQGKAVAAASSRLKSKSAIDPGVGSDKDLQRVVNATRADAPVVAQVPSEFVEALKGLEGDPLTLRMIHRLLAALRLYAKEDDGGAVARQVLDQWLRLRNYRRRVRLGELPPPTAGLPEVE